jgi:hypothetical protein
MIHSILETGGWYFVLTMQRRRKWSLGNFFILSENMKGILETVWNQVHYIEGLMGYGHPLFQWAVKEGEALDPPEHLSYDVVKVTHSMKVIKLVFPSGRIPPGEFLVLRRSETFDLSQPRSRIEAAKMIIGLIRHINY